MNGYVPIHTHTEISTNTTLDAPHTDILALMGEESVC